MSEPTCLRCARPLADGAYVCDRCASQAAQKLAEIADLSPACRDVAYGLSRRNGAGGSGKPGSRLPLDLTAMAKLDSVQRELTKWVDRIGTIRGAIRPWFVTRDDEPVTVAATWLAGHVEWIRHQADHEPDDDGNTWGADQFLTDVEACARVLRGLVRGPAPQRYLGPCGAMVAWPGDFHAGDGVPIETPCDGDVYAREGASAGACRLCGAEWSTAERKAWLDAEVRSHAYTATEISDAYPIKANTIRQWLSRGLLAAHGELDGRPLLLLGEVLDLAAGDAARREEARATRARRAAARETAEMGA